MLSCNILELADNLETKKRKCPYNFVSAVLRSAERFWKHSNHGVGLVFRRIFFISFLLKVEYAADLLYSYFDLFFPILSRWNILPAHNPLSTTGNGRINGVLTSPPMDRFLYHLRPSLAFSPSSEKRKIIRIRKQRGNKLVYKWGCSATVANHHVALKVLIRSSWGEFISVYVCRFWVLEKVPATSVTEYGFFWFPVLFSTIFRPGDLNFILFDPLPKFAKLELKPGKTIGFDIFASMFLRIGEAVPCFLLVQIKSISLYDVST